MIWKMAEKLCQSSSNCKKLGFAVCSSLRSTTSGLSPKIFEKRAHPYKIYAVKTSHIISIYIDKVRGFKSAKPIIYISSIR